MKSTDQMLILECCEHEDEKNEIASLKSLAKLYEFEIIIKKPKSKRQLRNALKSEIKYDYVFLSSHGNEKGFENESKSLQISWLDFAFEICIADCLEDNCILLLSCCRGGLNEIAFEMFWSCPSIS